MTNKKIILKVARIIRQNTGYKLPLSIEVAKQFLKQEYLEPTDKNDAFEFEWEWDGRVSDYQRWQGTLYKMDKLKKELSLYKTWQVPIELYKYQEIYQKQRYS